MATLKDDINAYEAQRTELEAAHLGEWALFRDGSLVELFTRFSDAAAAAVSRFGRGPYLIRQVGAVVSPLPASVLYGPVNGVGGLRV